MNKTQLIKLQIFLTLILLINLVALCLNFTIYKAVKEINTQPLPIHTITVVKDVVLMKQEPEIIETKELPEVIIEPKTEQELIADYINEICILYPVVKPELVKSVILHESNFDSKATNGTCIGLMQISTNWHQDRAERLGVTDFYDPYSNILLGVDYISELTLANNSVPLALMLYNMKHDEAYQMYQEGKISFYAKSVLAQAEIYKKGE